MVKLGITLIFLIMFTDSIYSEMKACLTWQLTLVEAKLTLNYSFSERELTSSEVRVYDNKFERLVTCQNHQCKLKITTDTYQYNRKINQYIFSIYRDSPFDFDGTWHGFYGKTGHSQTEISYQKGMSVGTKVRIESVIVYDEIIQKNFIYLTCSSCWVPQDYTVEFLINNKTGDKLTFDSTNNRCYSAMKAQICSKKLCNCTNTGKTFMRVFEHTKMNTRYSCNMMFQDEKTGTIFSKTASVFANETGMIDDTKVSIKTVIVYKEIIQKSLIYLTCSSFKVPNEYHVEFLINNRTTDTVIFDQESRLCYSAATSKVCDQETCNCSNTGNTFMRIFELTDIGTLYSCDMLFTDEKAGYKFSKIASVYVNKSGTFTLPSSTIVLRQSYKRSTVDGMFLDSSTISSKPWTVNHESRGFPDTVETTLVFTMLVALICVFLSVVVCQIITKFYARNRRMNNKRTWRRLPSQIPVTVL